MCASVCPLRRSCAPPYAFSVVHEGAGHLDERVHGVHLHGAARVHAGEPAVAAAAADGLLGDARHQGRAREAAVHARPLRGLVRRPAAAEKGDRRTHVWWTGVQRRGAAAHAATAASLLRPDPAGRRRRWSESRTLTECIVSLNLLPSSKLFWNACLRDCCRSYGTGLRALPFTYSHSTTQLPSPAVHGIGSINPMFLIRDALLNLAAQITKHINPAQRVAEICAYTEKKMEERKRKTFCFHQMSGLF